VVLVGCVLRDGSRRGESGGHGTEEVLEGTETCSSESRARYMRR
jgi:hypothetical protein